MKHILCTVVFVMILCSVSLKAQDSIPEEYKNISDTSGISQVLNKAKKYQFSNPDSVIYFLNIAETSALKLNSQYHLMQIYLIRGGSFHLANGRYQKSLEDFIRSQETAEKLGDDYYVNYIHMAISSVYMLQSYYPLAEKHLVKALQYFETTNNDNGIGGVYINMTFMNTEQKDYELALKNGELALKHYLKSGNNVGIARALINLSEVNFKIKNYDLALSNGREALHYTELSNQQGFNSNIFHVMGETFLAQNQLDSALNYFNLAVAITNNYENAFYAAKSKQGIAKVYAKYKDFARAISNAKEAYLVADNTATAQLKAETANLLSDYYAVIGNYKTSLEYKNIEAHINDSIFTKEKYKVQNEMEAIYQSQKKEQQIATLSKEKEIEVLKNEQSKYYIISLLTVMFIMVLVAILFFRNNKLKARQRTIELEQRLLRSQMNPHFIFNAISCIQEYIIDKRPMEAGAYLSDFAKLMRSILNNSATEFISLENEIETLNYYLELQKIRFPEKLEYKIIVPEDLEIDELAIPPMLSQPFIENAIEHGIAKKTDGTGEVKVEFLAKNGSLLLQIQDNGGGIQTNEGTNKKHQSMATKITQSRIDNFKKAYKRNVRFEISNILDDKNQVSGVQVMFELPKKYLN